MSKTFDQGKDEVAKLCQYFARNSEAFYASGVKEAHVRQSLIDPLFESLGWDVRNAAMIAPQYREVIPEDSLEVEGHQKAPDYTFRVGQTPKFYAEAKKCSVNIRTDPGPAYQLRRYGWSAKVAVSILTDFEELSVYDCARRPRQSEKAGNARILYFRYEEYPDRWRELWDIFSRESVWSGAFDQYAMSKRKRGTSEVDAEFLKEIETWRDTLARNIALRNENLSSDDLNAAVQLTIDRVIFLRMAEDRGIEPYEKLLKLCERPDIYARFMRDLCRKADQKYNSGLFHFQTEAGVSEAPDRITPRLAIDDKVFKAILQGLYFTHGSPYHFGVLPVEILGTVYERFLGKVIRLTAGHQAKVEEKPEVRKAGGVYYTPAYIVDYIVKQTVEKQIAKKSPAQLAGKGKAQPFRVLDMACGSGSFLLGAYQCLLDHCLKWYTEHKPKTQKKTLYQDPKRGWRLTIEEKKRILTTHIFGVDIDPQAMEVSKLSLLLKVLEGETDQTVAQQMTLFQERTLPNLADNIKCGNSLIGPDYLSDKLLPDADELKWVNPFDWKQGFPDAMKAGGFDCVIGNPPYVRQETLGETFKEYAEQHFVAYHGMADLFVYFIEKGLSLVKEGGQMSYIVANKWMRTNYGLPLRIWMREKRIEEIVDFGDLPVFQGATTYPCILRISKAIGTKEFDLAHVNTLQFQSLSEYVQEHVQKSSRDRLDPTGWSLTDNRTLDLLEKIGKAGIPLGEYVESKIFYGIKTGLNEAFVIDRATRNRLVREDRKSAEIIKPLLAGREIKRYTPPVEANFLILFPRGFTNRNCSSRVNAWEQIQKNYPAIAKHLEPYEAKAKDRYDKGDYWWELRACDYYAEFEKPKILLPDISLRCNALLDVSGEAYCVNTAYMIANSEKYLLGLLNSSLLTFFYRHLSPSYRGGYLRFIFQYLVQLPIRTLSLTNSADKSLHDCMVSLVDSMLSLHKQLAAARSEAQKDVIQRQIDAIDRELDRLVYDLYSLTEKEIAIVEGTGS